MNYYVFTNNIKYCTFTVYFANNFTILTAGKFHILRTGGIGFHFSSTDCPKMAQSYVFVYRYSTYGIFKRPKIIPTWCSLPESQGTFPYEYIPEVEGCVISFKVYDQCHDVQITNDSIDFTCRSAVIDSSNNL
jgi:hypothetical protein